MPTIRLWDVGKILHYHADESKDHGEVLVLGIRDHTDMVVLVLTNPFRNLWTAQQGQSYIWAAAHDSSRAYHFAEECSQWSYNP